MIKLLMTWDIKAGRESAYLDFVSQKFTPELIQWGLEPSEVWYTYWGEGPQILMGFLAEDGDALRQRLGKRPWRDLLHQLDDYVMNFHYKLLPPSGRFQL